MPLWRDKMTEQQHQLSVGHGTPSQQAPPTSQGVAGGAGVGVGARDLFEETKKWWDLAGHGDPTVSMPSFQAPSVSAPQVKPPQIPKTPEVIPGLYTEGLSQEKPTSEFEQLIDDLIGRRPEAPPPITVDDEWINEIIGHYGLEPRSQEEIREAARAVVERQAFQKDQIVQRELDRFERDFPNEFRRAQKDVMNAAKDLTGDMQEEAAARGMFYSSVMSGAATALDAQVMEHISDIASAAATRVSFLRDEQRDIEEWAILEEEVVFRQMEAVDRQERQQLMHMHVEVATWADQMNLDRWYKHEQLMFQHDQLELAGIQFKMQEAERLGQHYATAMMADHPLVQGSLQNMGITPEAYAGMGMEQQAAIVNKIVGFNEVEQQMRQREFQMRAVVAEIQLQNASLALQASIASGQFHMQAMGMQLQARMHQDQMGLAWAGHALDATALTHGMEMDRLQLSRMGGGDGAAASVAGFDFEAYDRGMGIAAAVHAGDMPSQMLDQYIRSVDPETASALTRDSSAFAPQPQPASPAGRSVWDILGQLGTTPTPTTPAGMTGQHDWF